MRTFPNEDQVLRAAKALFADNYVDAPQRQRIVDQHWAHVSDGVRAAYTAKARFVVEAALGGPYA